MGKSFNSNGGEKKMLEVKFEVELYFVYKLKMEVKLNLCLVAPH